MDSLIIINGLRAAEMNKYAENRDISLKNRA